MSNKNLLNGIDILWKRATVPVARLKKSTVFYYGDYENKANIFTNGTLRLDRIDDADTGPYSVVVSDANGRNIHSEIAQLFMMSKSLFKAILLVKVYYVHCLALFKHRCYFMGEHELHKL